MEGSTGKAYREDFISAQDGLRLYFRDYGPKYGGATPVLCLAGLTRNSRDFQSVANRIATERRVICLDYRGRGRSEYDQDWRNYTPETYIQDIRHLLAGLGLGRVFVIGTSMGGLLAMGLGIAMPGALAGVVINDVGPDIDDDGLANIIKFLSTGAQGFASWEAAIGSLRSFFPNLPANDDEMWMKIARGTFREADDGTVIHDWDSALLKPLAAGSPPTNLWSMFRSLRRLPLVVVLGALSDILSAETLTAMAEAIPTLRAVTVPGVGHAPTLSETEVEEAIDDALATADRTQH